MTARRPKSMLRVAGMMSGTSADGVDVAVVDIAPGRAVDVLAFAMFPYPAAMRRRIFRLFDPKTSGVNEVCEMNFAIGEFFAACLIELCRRHRIPLRSIDAIGSHGQTIWHDPRGIPRGILGKLGRPGAGKGRIASTLQIGEPSVIAQRTGITTVADFRPRDIAALGQGAPLVPMADLVLFGHASRARALQNIGGIANVTYLPAMGKAAGCGTQMLFDASIEGWHGGRRLPTCAPHGCRQRTRGTSHAFEKAIAGIRAFDTGPGNMIIDRVTWHVTGGRQSFDKGGALAARGAVREGLLKEMMRHAYFRRRPPKTTGREMFGISFSDALYAKATRAGIEPRDILATVTALTARSIADAYGRFLPPVGETIVCGGGARNATLVAMLRQALGTTKVLVMDETGIDADAKEAVSFAILAAATLTGVPGNVPSATGAGGRVVLGKIIPGS